MSRRDMLSKVVLQCCMRQPYLPNDAVNAGPASSSTWSSTCRPTAGLSPLEAWLLLIESPRLCTSIAAAMLHCRHFRKSSQWLASELQ
jgi:hypothetical protein